MLANLILKLGSPIDSLEKNHPLMSMLLFQILTAIGMIIVVGSIALAGGLAIWLFIDS